MIKRAIIAAFIAALSVWAWRRLDFIPIDVIGQPASTGPIQSKIEAPFFQSLAQDTGLPLRVRYRSLDMVGYKDTHQLAILNESKADLISLRFAQNSAIMPELMGVDLGGLSIDLKQGRSLVQAYSPVIDQKLQERFGSKLLAIWPFGPQVLFCRKPIMSLRDVAGLKVRIAGSLLEPLVSALDAIPVVTTLEDVTEGLRLGIFDCAISSSASANFAGWPKYSTHYYPITLQLGLNGYAMRLAVWNCLSTVQQGVLLEAFQKHAEAIWTYAEMAHVETSSCNTGGPCTLGVRYDLIQVKPSQEDADLLKKIMQEAVFKKWAAACDRISENCSKDFLERLDFIFSKE